MEELSLKKEQVLASLKKAVDNKILKIVNKNNKKYYCFVNETHLDEECFIDSQIRETLESTDVHEDLTIRLKETAHKNFTNLAN